MAIWINCVREAQEGFFIVIGHDPSLLFLSPVRFGVSSFTLPLPFRPLELGLLLPSLAFCPLSFRLMNPLPSAPPALEV